MEARTPTQRYATMEAVIARVYREEHRYPTHDDLLRYQELSLLLREYRNPMGGDVGNS